jgi:hypothetical protein
MSWGFKGIFKRILEFPGSAAQSQPPPAGRMRIRYNDALDRGEESVNGAPYQPFSSGGLSPASASSASSVGVVLPDDIGNPVDLGTVVVDGGNVPKMIIVTVELVNDGAQTVRLSLRRNGVDLSEVFATTIEAAGIKTLTTHWYDPTPGNAAVTYSVRGSATGLPTTTAGNRRVTAISA